MKPLMLLAALAACGETGQAPISVPLHAQGGATSVEAGAWHVELTRAMVGFGPAYFCASANADLDLCPTAVVELARSVPIDALGGEVELGALDGVTGTVHGAMYDWGYSWFFTEPQPSANPDAPGGHSLELAGTASNGATTLAFTADVRVPPSNPGAPAVRAQRTERVLRADEDSALRVTIDASAWVASIDFDALASLGPTVVIVEGMAAYSALVNGMVSAAPAAFTWSP